jgi:hypothetical protein
MTGILELFALVEFGSGIGFLVTWRNRLLASKVNYFHPPHNKKVSHRQAGSWPDRTSRLPDRTNST